MKRLYNRPEDVARETLEGLSLACIDLVELGPAARYVRRRILTPGKVALVSGGGSGHEPLHAGFVGQGMLDAACPGEIFSSPTPDRISDAAMAVDTGAGVLFIVKNYAGDVMNFEMAVEMMAGRTVASVIVGDDVVEDLGSTRAFGRRGIAGVMVVEKIVGAAAEQGLDLPALKALGDRTASATRTMGLSLRPCTLPLVGQPMFAITESEIEMGVGIHGERGFERSPLAPAGALASKLVDTVIASLAPNADDPLLLLVNGLGATTASELYITVLGCVRRLRDHGFEPARRLAGSYVTSLETEGVSVTLTRLDEELMAFWDAPVHTAALRWGR